MSQLPISIDIDEQWLRDRFADMLIDMAEELRPGITRSSSLDAGHVDAGCSLRSVCKESITGPLINGGRIK